MNEGPRIVFMGTPEFAVASLGALIMNGYNVVAVVTAPDKPAGRGKKIKKSAVACYAEENYLDVLKPERLKDEGFISALKALTPDIFVVVAFRMLPEAVWSIPVIGTFNLHASLLPQYRGAAPINHAIINGEKSTGITTFLIDDRIDTGKILYRRKLIISHAENAGELHDRLMRSGAKLVVKTVKMLAEGKAKAKSQEDYIRDGMIIRPAPKIFPDDCFIDWAQGSETVHNFIRGLSPHPGARTYFKAGDRILLVKIMEARPAIGSTADKPGIIRAEKKGGLRISTSDGYIDLIRIQPEGRKVMKVSDYLRGADAENLALATNPQV